MRKGRGFLIKRKHRVEREEEGRPLKSGGMPEDAAFGKKASRGRGTIEGAGKNGEKAPGAGHRHALEGSKNQ